MDQSSRCGGDNTGFTAFPPGSDILGGPLVAAINAHLPEYVFLIPGGNLTGLPFNASADASAYVLGCIAFVEGSIVEKDANWVSDITDFSGVAGGSFVRTPNIFAGAGGPFADSSSASSAAEAAIVSAVPGDKVLYGKLIRLSNNGGNWFYAAFAAYGLP